MTTTAKLMLAMTMLGMLGGCVASAQPQLTAYQRNVGPGSSLSGVPSTSDGSLGRPGDPVVAGVSSAGPITR
jgi:hypothetical protein